MFTGIIESIGTVEKLVAEETNLHITVSAPIAQELKIDQSVSHNGVCLTVVSIKGDSYTVTAIKETLDRTNLGALKQGAIVNLERCMPANGRYDGHIVQGHVDHRATMKSVTEEGGSWVFDFELDEAHKGLIVEKGSICVNGISLTVASVAERSFTVAIIPYTYEHTNLQQLVAGNTVNIEFDVLGKYVAAMLAHRGLS